MRYELFSKRQQRIRGEVPDVYQYETIPPELRVQVFYIWQDVWGEIRNSSYDRFGGSVLAIEAYGWIDATLRRKYGVLVLGRGDNIYEKVRNFLFRTEETDKVIDIIEVSFRYIDQVVRGKRDAKFAPNISPDDAIDELNYQFRDHRVGYQYETGLMARVDSQLIHSEVVKPALSFLSDPIYNGANEEFLQAHEHYRKRNYKDCVNNCLNAFESCLKIICKKRRWAYKEKDGSQRLIKNIFDHGLIPPLMQSHFSALRSTLESGVPTVRNNQTGHGQGSEGIIVPEYIASYILHLTASNILLLAKADEDMK